MRVKLSQPFLKFHPKLRLNLLNFCPNSRLKFLNFCFNSRQRFLNFYQNSEFSENFLVFFFNNGNLVSDLLCNCTSLCTVLWFQFSPGVQTGKNILLTITYGSKLFITFLALFTFTPKRKDELFVGDPEKSRPKFLLSTTLPLKARYHL